MSERRISAVEKGRISIVIQKSSSDLSVITPGIFNGKCGNIEVSSTSIAVLIKVLIEVYFSLNFFQH